MAPDQHGSGGRPLCASDVRRPCLPSRGPAGGGLGSEAGDEALAVARAHASPRLLAFCPA
jgi:hypothetical protein